MIPFAFWANFLVHLATIGATKTIAPPNMKMYAPSPAIVVIDTTHPVPANTARIPDTQANTRLNRPSRPIMSEIGAITRARKPNIIVMGFDIASRLRQIDRTQVDADYWKTNVVKP